jgi:CubicO group peptidase (beta-lactamase class C family)
MLTLMKATITFLAFWAYLTSSLSAQELPLRIERYLNTQVAESGFDGTVLVADGDEVLINKSFMSANAPDSKISRAQDKFPVGSIAEQFIAAAILQLELAGRVRLDSSICDYISDCPGSWKPIHILHLLTHSSGLPSLQEGSPCVQRADLKPRAIMAMLSARPLLFEPGNRFNLNSLDYFFLSAVIEKISGQSTSKYLDQQIFHPLKLAQTGYSLPASQPKVAEAQTPAGCRQGELAANLVSFFSGELYSSTGDLYRWNQALATEKFLPANSLNQMYAPYIDGYGFGVKILKEFDRKVAVQNNESDSNSVSIRMYPDDDTCVIVVSRVHGVAASGLSHGLGALLFPKQPSAVRHRHH